MTAGGASRLIKWVARFDPDQEFLYGDLLESLGPHVDAEWLLRELLSAAWRAAARSIWTARRTFIETAALGSITLAALVFASLVTLSLGFVLVGVVDNWLLPAP
jgi:hypothetical protein